MSDVIAGGPSPMFWLRWSWRDLRHHWIALVVISLVIAIGTGVYAGLSNTSTWRLLSYDSSYATTRLHDLRIAAAPGAFVETGRLRAVVDSIPSADAVEQATERLVVASQLAVGDEILVTARIIGGTLDATAVDRVVALDGDVPVPDSGAAVLETKFAEYHDLPTSGEVTVAGAETVPYTGLGVGPEEFFITTPEGTVMAEADLATLYLHLDDAQRITGHADLVNEVVLTVGDDSGIGAIADELRAAAAALPDAGLTVTDVSDVDAHRILYEDIDNDQQFFTMFAVLVLMAAALAAFTLVNRIVAAQRREIGIGMAIGLARRHLAIRPLTIGVAIAVLGVVAGLGSGFLMAQAMQDLLEDVLPLPDYRTPFQIGPFARAAALGVAIPMAASAWPVWRAVSVEPIEAIRVGHLTIRGRSRLTGRHLRLPVSSIAMVPVRQILRAPWRAGITATGVGIAIAALVSVFGMLDSFTAAIDVADADITRGGRDRVIVQLTETMPLGDPRITAIDAVPAVGTIDPGLRLPATVVGDDGAPTVDLLIDAYDVDSAVWTPVGDGGAATDGLVISRKAADDLDVAVGDRIALRHPALTADGVTVVESTVAVIALHDNPVRALAYLDDSVAAGLFGASGVTNLLSVMPAPGATGDQVERALFGADGLTSTFPVARMSEAVDEALSTFTGFLLIIAGAVVGLAGLIAVNASRIAVEERRREHATMRAFGLPVRTIVMTLIAEGAIIGVAATGIGLGLGALLLDWLLGSLADRTLQEFSITRRIAMSTVGLAMSTGLAAVTLAPLLLIARLRRMDLPSTLRVME